MELQDDIDPERWEELQSRITGLAAIIDDDQRRATFRQQTQRQLLYHAGLLRGGSHNPSHDWARMHDAVERLMSLGVPESDPWFREPLRPLIDQLPEEFEDTCLQRVVEWVAYEDERALARQGLREFATDEQSEHVLTLRSLVQGRTLVLVGGHSKPDTVTKLEQAFACNVQWLDTRPHQPPEELRPAIVRPDVLLVILLIRWSSHDFGMLQGYCQEQGKLFVRAPGGYNANGLAHAVLEQVGQQLEALAAQSVQ